jgi:3-phosphoshikimate 1-carboxyvinyltransferase
MLNWFGVPVKTKTNPDGMPAIAVDGPVAFDARDVSVPGDISSAAFLIAAAALLPGSVLELDGVGLNPTRTQFLMTLCSLGLDVVTSGVREECNEPVGRILVSGKSHPVPKQHGKSNSVNGNLIPRLIDELPLLAVIGTQVSAGMEIRDAAELRFKETDRISATVKNLRAMGAEVEEFEDGLAVAGPSQLRGARLDSYGDHRIAMAFAIAGLLAHGESEIAGAECIEISFPEFFELLESVTER